MGTRAGLRAHRPTDSQVLVLVLQGVGPIMSIMHLCELKELVGSAASSEKPLAHNICSRKLLRMQWEVSNGVGADGFTMAFPVVSKVAVFYPDESKQLKIKERTTKEGKWWGLLQPSTIPQPLSECPQIKVNGNPWMQSHVARCESGDRCSLT